MAAEGTGTYPTLMEVSKTWGADGRPLPIVEMLAQTNEPLLDMPWKESNETAGERNAIRTGLPDAIWRRFYQGVPVGRSTVAQITDSLGMLEARGQVDVDLANLNGNSAAWRLQENYAFIESMNQTMMHAIIYGDATTDPEQFNGLAPRFSQLSTTVNTVGYQNIIDASGAGSDNTSIWLVCWGFNSVYGIYPKGSKAGIIHKDLGEIDAYDTSNDPYRVLADLYQWKCGLVVKDWRYVVRIANIDVSNLVDEQSAADLVKLMIKALHRVPNLGIVQTGQANPPANGAPGLPLAPNPVFYVNRTVAEMLDIQSLNKTQYTLKSGSDVYGRPVTFCRGIPVRTCDQISSGEDTITT